MGRFKVSLRRQGEVPVDRLELSLEPRLELSLEPLKLLAPQAINNLPTPLDPERDTTAVATGEEPVLGPGSPVFGLEPAVRSTLPEVEDGRNFHPDSVVPSRRIRGSSSSLKAGSPSGEAAKFLPRGVAFSNSDSVIICVRRHARRQVIMATGKGGGSHAGPKLKPTSSLWCYHVRNARRL